MAPSAEDYQNGMAKFLQFYSILCGFGIFAIGLVVAWESVTYMQSAVAPGQSADAQGVTPAEKFGTGFGMFCTSLFAVVFGLIVVATELHLVCIVRYLGFLSKHWGRGVFLIFNGLTLSALFSSFLGKNGKKEASYAPLVIGIMALVAGAFQLTAVLPCCSIPTDPLQEEFSERSRIVVQVKKENKGKTKQGAQQVQQPPPVQFPGAASAPPPAAPTAKRNPFGRKAEPEASPPPPSGPPSWAAAAQPASGPGGGIGAPSWQTRDVEAPRQDYSSNYSAPAPQSGPPPGAEDNPFFGNKHLKTDDNI